MCYQDNKPTRKRIGYKVAVVNSEGLSDFASVFAGNPIITQCKAGYPISFGKSSSMWEDSLLYKWSAYLTKKEAIDYINRHFTYENLPTIRRFYTGVEKLVVLKVRLSGNVMLGKFIYGYKEKIYDVISGEVIESYELVYSKDTKDLLAFK